MVFPICDPDSVASNHFRHDGLEAAYENVQFNNTWDPFSAYVGFIGTEIQTGTPVKIKAS